MWTSPRSVREQLAIERGWHRRRNARRPTVRAGERDPCVQSKFVGAGILVHNDNRLDQPFGVASVRGTWSSLRRIAVLMSNDVCRDEGRLDDKVTTMSDLRDSARWVADLDDTRKRPLLSYFARPVCALPSRHRSQTRDRRFAVALRHWSSQERRATTIAPQTRCELQSNADDRADHRATTSARIGDLDSHQRR